MPGLAFCDVTVTLEYVDQLLDSTSAVGTDTRAAQIRAWRDELAHVAVLLSYARHVLSVDLGVLRSAAGRVDANFQAVVDELPKLLAAASIGGGWSLSPDAPATMAPAEQVLEGEADGLLAAHGELASLDISSRADIVALIGQFEDEMSQVTARWERAEARVRDLQAALVAMYKSGEASVDDWLQ